MGGSSSSSSSGAGGPNCTCTGGQTLYPTGVDCGALHLDSAGILCTGGSTAGFQEASVPCGGTGTFVTCQLNLLLACVAITTTPPPIQQCH